jgi:hypothetical protein
VTCSGKFGEYWANFCDSLWRIWRVLSKFSEFGEDRLDRFIPKNIFFLYIKWPSFKIRQIRQNAVTDSPDSPTFAKGHFWKNVTRIWHIRTSNLPFPRIWGEWPLLKIFPCYIFYWGFLLFPGLFRNGDALLFRRCCRHVRKGRLVIPFFWCY